jgi:hypothetical protein
MSIPRELAQARLLELTEAALELMPDQRGGAPGGLASMSRDRLIEFILEKREQRDRHFRLKCLEFLAQKAGMRPEREGLAHG